jgi:hypothetical protein
MEIMIGRGSMRPNEEGKRVVGRKIEKKSKKNRKKIEKKSKKRTGVYIGCIALLR